MSRRTCRIVIVGGGSAGWLTAGVIAAKHGPDTGVHVTLVESPDVQPIGVGEGTWPTMRDTLRHIGISETGFLLQCDASFKQGTRFDGWVTGQIDDRFYHPFVLPQGYTEANLVDAWLLKHSATPFADLVSFQPHLCASGKAPKQPSTPEFAAVANYAYHLDAGKFGVFLRQHCISTLGVRHVAGHVDSVNAADNGDIAAVCTREHGEISGDLFVDCSGLSSLLLGTHYNVPFLNQQDTLFANTALAVQLPYTESNTPIESQTISTAQDAGWIWDIGLPTRRGIGYVYASGCASDDDAERTLRSYVAKTSGVAAASLPSPRRLSITPGYRQRFWHRNCVAVGLSAGFVEPLEASALVLVELSAAMIADDWPANRETMDIVATRFNARFRYRWERIVEFLKLHYALSRRPDSEFWVGHRDPASMPHRLRDQLALWRNRPPSRYDFHQVEEVFPSASYQYVLYGMGFRPHASEHGMTAGTLRQAESRFMDAAKMTQKMLSALPTNRELLESIGRKPLKTMP